MKVCAIDYDCSLVTNQEFVECGQRLSIEIKRIKKLLEHGYDSPYASLYMLRDNAYLHAIEQLIVKKKELNPAMIIVIGIGGSNLGAMAVQQALYGLFHNEQGYASKIYYADSVDPDYTRDIVAQAQHHLNAQESILLIIISKSGTTLETVANGHVFLNILMQEYPEAYHHYVVVITDKDSPLDVCAKNERFDVLFIPQHVGGRYSILSAAGLFVLGMIDIDIVQLVEGAQFAISNGLHDDVFHNHAALLAAILYVNYQKQYTIVDFFAFSAEFEMLGKWYRQLVGESLGKEFDIDGNLVHAGIVPTVSVGTADLHSIGQLYLSGPHTIMTLFIVPHAFRAHIDIQGESAVLSLLPPMQEHSYSFMMHSIMQGVGVSLAKQKRPFITIELAQKDPFCIGYFMQMLMMQIMYVGFLMHVNPFDQPHVELYKKETRKILSDE